MVQIFTFSKYYSFAKCLTRLFCYCHIAFIAINGFGLFLLAAPVSCFALGILNIKRDL